MADGDITSAIVPLIGLGILAGVAGKVMDKSFPKTRTRTVYRKHPVKGVSIVKHHHKHKGINFLK